MPEKKKIYMLTCGAYSDYRIVAIFDDIELAQEAMLCIDEFETIGESEIREYELNPTVLKPKKGWNYWEINMDRDGNVSYVNLVESVLVDDSIKLSKELMSDIFVDGTFHFFVYSDTKERAIKIANEKRIQIKLFERL